MAWWKERTVHFSTEPKLKLCDWTEARKLSSINQNIVIYEGAYYMPSSIETIELHKKDCKDFVDNIF